MKSNKLHACGVLVVFTSLAVVPVQAQLLKNVLGGSDGNDGGVLAAD